MSMRAFASSLGAAALVFLGSAAASHAENANALSSGHSTPRLAQRVVVVSGRSQITVKGYSYAEAVALLDEIDASGAIPVEYIEGRCPGLIGVEYPAHNTGPTSPRSYCYLAGTHLIAPPASLPAGPRMSPGP
jgi:hypothetical protein